MVMSWKDAVFLPFGAQASLDISREQLSCVTR